MRLGLLYHHILWPVTYISREHWDFVSIIGVHSMMYATDRVHYGLWVVFVCLPITVIIIIMQTYRKALNLHNACQIYAVVCASEITSMLSIILYSIYGAVYRQLT